MSPARDTAEAIALPVLALAGGLLLFGFFVWLGGHSPVIRPWWGVSGPAGMPQAVVDRVYAATLAILRDADTRQRYATMGLEIAPLTVKEFNDFTVTELVKWTKIVKDSGAKVE